MMALLDNIYRIVSYYTIQPSKISTSTEIGYGNIFKACLFLIGITSIFFIIIYPCIRGLQVKWRARALNACLPPACRKYWSARFHLLKNFNKVDPGELFGNLDPLGNDRIYGLYLNGPFDCVTSDPQLLKQIFSGPQFKTFVKGPELRAVFKDLLASNFPFQGASIFNCETDSTWKFHREKLQVFFSKSRLGDVKIDRIDKILQMFYEHSNTNTPIDIQDVFHRFTFDTALEFFAGFNTTDTDVSYTHSASELNDAFNQATKNTVIGFFGGPFRLLFKQIPRYSLKKPMQTLNSVMDKLIQDAIDRKTVDEKETLDLNKTRLVHDYPTFLDYLVVQIDDRKMIRDQLFSVIFGGRDPIAVLLTSIMFHLCEHPEIYQQMRDSVLNILGNNEKPDHLTIKDCKLIHAVIKETLRFTSNAPVSFRVCSKDTVLKASDGQSYFFPKDSSIFMYFWALHRDPAFWGDDADKWDPYRWLDDRHQKLVENPSIYQPFAMGPRTCPGQLFTYQLVSLTLARICQAVEKIERATDIQPSVLPTIYLTLKWKGGMFLRMTPDPNYQMST